MWWQRERLKWCVSLGTCQGSPGPPNNHWEPRREAGTFRSFRRNQSCNTVISDVWPVEFGDNCFLLFKSPSLWVFAIAALGGYLWKTRYSTGRIKMCGMRGVANCQGRVQTLLQNGFMRKLSLDTCYYHQPHQPTRNTSRTLNSTTSRHFLLHPESTAHFQAP